MATNTLMVKNAGPILVAQRPHSSLRFACRARASAPRPPCKRRFSPFSSCKKIFARRPIARGAKSRVATILSQDAQSEEDDSLEKATKKYGREGEVLTSIEKEAADVTPREWKPSDAKELLKKYGSAYLITSISLSLISFGLCYLLVSAGLDVSALLAKVGIEVTNNSEKVGTVALAYAAHKAASPIRFPPTVALTPIVAKTLGKKVAEETKR